MWCSASDVITTCKLGLVHGGLPACVFFVTGLRELEKKALLFVTWSSSIDVITENVRSVYAGFQSYQVFATRHIKLEIIPLVAATWPSCSDAIPHKVRSTIRE